MGVLANKKGGLNDGNDANDGMMRYISSTNHGNGSKQQSPKTGWCSTQNNERDLRVVGLCFLIHIHVTPKKALKTKQLCTSLKFATHTQRSS